MKISKETTKKFSPYSITISVEHAEDEGLLYEMSKQQYFIPQLLYPNDKYRHTQLQTFLNELMKAIQK